MWHIVMMSGGAGSWCAAKRVAALHGTEKLIMVFADTLIEDLDLYRFLGEAVRNVGGLFCHLREGRDVWEVFNDVRFLGNSRIDPCSRVLKRDLCQKWVRAGFTPENALLYVGIDWTEGHRTKAVIEAWAPYTVIAPLTQPPYLSKKQICDLIKAEGIEPPRLYGMGFPHNNCRGFCVKAGQAQFALLLEKMPINYAYHERKEKEIREKLGKDVAILRHTSGPEKGKPWTLEAYRKHLECKGAFDKNEWGGCGCFA